MSGPDPQREQKSETAEKGAIQKTHEEFIGDMAQPSVRKKDYEKHKETEKQKAREKSDQNKGDQPKAKPDTTSD